MYSIIYIILGIIYAAYFFFWDDDLDTIKKELTGICYGTPFEPGFVFFIAAFVIIVTWPYHLLKELFNA